MLTLEVSKLSSFLDLPTQEANITNEVRSFGRQGLLYKDLIIELKDFINRFTESVIQVPTNHWTEKAIIFSDKRGNLYEVFFLFLLDIGGKDTHRICYELYRIKNGKDYELENFNPNLSLKENIQLLFEEPQINPISTNQEWEEFRKDNEFYWCIGTDSPTYRISHLTTGLGIKVLRCITKGITAMPLSTAYRSEEEAKQALVLLMQNEAKKLS